MSAAIDHSKMSAWALCWPADPRPLLYRSEERAEEDRRWFSKNFTHDNDGNPRGEPFVLRLEVAASLRITS